MSIIRPMKATDLLKFNSVNVDAWTETYTAKFYLQYLSTWPDQSCVVSSSDDKVIHAYLIGKDEPPEPHPLHHGHITAVTVSPPFRSIGLARKLCDFLEDRSGPNGHDTWFLDLFVRCNNKRAIEMYERMGYSVFRRVVGYYSGMGDSPDETDAFDMRKSMPRDTDRKHIRPNGKEINVAPHEVWS